MVRRQADRPYEVCYRHAIVKSQQRHVVVEIAVAEFLRNRSQHEPRLRAQAVVAAIVLAERHFDHKPHKSFHAMCGCNDSGD